MATTQFVARNGLIAQSDSTISGSLFVSQSVTATSFTGSFSGSIFGYVPTSQTASFATTGSNIFIGNQTVTGSLFTSGSNTLIGTTTLSGSFNVSGSTLQQGNNTLFGNTLLTGSIIISGSLTPGSPTASVQIYGDIRQSGYHRFDPVSTNIDQSVTASYIYVSGSTNDLYFTQNGLYSNTTRLRWLESNLSTGLLRGGNMTSTPGSTTFTVNTGEGMIVTMNASLTNDPYPTIKTVSWPTQTLNIQYSGSAKITYVGIDSNGTVIQQTSAWGANDITEWDNSISLGVVLHLSGSVSTGVFNSPQISYGHPQQADDFFRAFGPLKISGHTLKASGSAPTLRIIKDGGSAYREGVNYINNPSHPSTVVEGDITTSKIFRYYISGSTPIIDTGVGSAGYTVIDNDNYVNTATGQLASVGNSNWTIQRVFWIPNSPTNAFIVYYGNAKYATLLNALNAKDSEAFTEAPNTALDAIFLGYIIVEGGSGRDLLNADEATIIPAGIFRSVGGVGASGTTPVSTTLAGLSDVALTTRAQGDLLVYGNGTEWNNTKTLNGTYTISGSLNVTTNLNATASWATDFVSASNYVLNTQTSSFVTNSQTSSFVTNSQTSSFVQNSQTSSFVTNSQTSSFVQNSQTSSFVTNSQTSSFATTGSNIFIGNQIISGSLTTTGSVKFTNLTTSSQQWVLTYDSASGQLYYTASSAIGGGSSPTNITIKDEGNNLTSAPTSINFTGNAVSASVSGNDVTVTISTGSATGGTSRIVTSIASNTTAASASNTDYIYLVSNPTTLTLPTAVSNTNQYTVKRVGTNAITVAASGSQTIDGSSTISLNVTNQAVSLISDNSNWNII